LIRPLSIAFTVVVHLVLLNVGDAGARHHHHPLPATIPTTVPPTSTMTSTAGIAPTTPRSDRTMTHQTSRRHKILASVATVAPSFDFVVTS
jgi:hypothetical protein